jgi:hypothetical protein
MNNPLMHSLSYWFGSSTEGSRHIHQIDHVSAEDTEEIPLVQCQAAQQFIPQKERTFHRAAYPRKDE